MTRGPGRAPAERGCGSGSPGRIGLFDPATRAGVFPDANVLFAAAYREGAGLQELWKRADVELITSGYAAEEARRNLDKGDRRPRLEALLAAVRIDPEAPHLPLPDGVRLPEKDTPIRRAAMAAEATQLLTGDLPDFGHLLGQRVGGLDVQTPGDFLRRHR